MAVYKNYNMVTEEEVSLPEHLEEVSTAERISLVDDDKIRRNAQIIIAVGLIAMAVGYLAAYTYFIADAEFRLGLAQDFRVLIIMGVGAALAIFGLGRTVGRKK